jgi:putative transposase
MYEWRKMNDQERWRVLGERRKAHKPHHAPPKYETLEGLAIVTAACFEHQPLMEDRDRRKGFSLTLLALADQLAAEVHAWTVLENHYHILLELSRPTNLRPEFGRLHGRTSRAWNLQDGTMGRKCWYHSFERPIRSRSHYYRSLNYIHHNAVKHEYCDRWEEWETHSALEFIERYGRETATEIWRGFPIKSYGDSIEP